MGPLSGQVPSQETRGGDRVDWAHAQPGEPLPERGETYPDSESEALGQLSLWDADPDDNPDDYTYDDYDDDGRP